ncbi:tyrosine-type recombinase/integrase [Tardiphaga robiniae]|uniref:tyrosine-type recombinase/integrase n=1 Tax=Tardiphaga robiniae TaxID=943830 RepID=UPI001585D8F8|nr:integrase arm-type DNA-binding domain-containing protein [Tardiphaga robiniae]NUU44558.1 integrase arm-type DNA-binding domain-containing protein [Tardiphaga robiniae]
MAASKGLTAIEVTKQKKPGRYADGGGLYLQVTNAGTKSWLLRYMIAGRAREMGLGPVNLVTLAEARENARAGRKLILTGVDPLEQRRAERLQASAAHAKLMTFEQAAEKYITAHQTGWKSAKHGDQWRSTLETYAYPTIGRLAVDAIDTNLVLKILEQTESEELGAPTFWAGKTETASRVRGRIEKILDWAKARKLRDGENPARWRGHLDQLLPAKSSVAPVRHHKALPYADLPAFMVDLRAKNSISARALEFTILTAARTSDTIEGTRSELNIQEKLWTVPKARMKGKKGARKYDHVVPLCERACDIVELADGTGEFIFPGAEEGTPLSNMAMLELLQGMEGFDNDLTVHGFRSTFKDWCAEQTSYPNEVSEMALAHTVSDKVEAAYRRGNMREKRRRLMDDWAQYCAGGPRNASVVPIRAAST